MGVSKKTVNTISAIGLAVCAIVFFATGGIEAGAVGIVSGAGAVVATGIALYNLIFKK